VTDEAGFSGALLFQREPGGSGRINADNVIRPKSLFRISRSWRILAITGIALMAAAVARNSVKVSRLVLAPQ
jgi:hypothetical protein